MANPVDDSRYLREIDLYLKARHPGAREKALERINAVLGIDLREQIGKQILGLPFGVAGKIAIAGATMLMKEGIYRMYNYTYESPITPFSPETDLDNWAGYMFWTWKTNGKPSYQLRALRGSGE